MKELVGATHMSVAFLRFFCWFLFSKDPTGNTIQLRTTNHNAEVKKETTPQDTKKNNTITTLIKNSVYSGLFVLLW